MGGLFHWRCKMTTTKKTNEAKQDEAEHYKVKVTATLVNLRKEPGLASDVVRIAKRGDELMAVSDDGTWSLLDGGMYAMTRYLERIEPC